MINGMPTPGQHVYSQSAFAVLFDFEGIREDEDYGIVPYGAVYAPPRFGHRGAKILFVQWSWGHHSMYRYAGWVRCIIRDTMKNERAELFLPIYEFGAILPWE